MIGVTSFRLSRIPHLRTLLNASGCRLVTPLSIRKVAGIAGWGVKQSGCRAIRLARRSRKNCFLLEDGFLRSLFPCDPPLSITVEAHAIRHDSSRVTELDERLQRQLTVSQRNRARKLIEGWKTASVSKYNHLPEYDGPLPERYVLVADQLQGDDSVPLGGADATSFHTIVDAALKENPGATIVVKAHPLAASGTRKGYLDPADYVCNSRLIFVTTPCSPVSLIEKADAVYTVTSQLGFEALIHGKCVRTFGMPFYAGRGLTDDGLPRPHWRKPVDLETLVHVCLVELARYITPETGERCEAETVLEHLALQRRMRGRWPQTVYAVGFPVWKRHYLRRFLAGQEIRFARSAHHCPQGSTIAVWGSEPVEMPRGAKVIRIEDGFLRSVGLGADLWPPLSWCIDDMGIHYDPRTPSRLEHLLATTVFDEHLIDRARRLRERIVSAGISKYNITGRDWHRPNTPRKIILVPGQVEDDASILLGTKKIRTNLQLVRAVRDAHPDAWIVYKPHPDVAAGLRCGGAEQGKIAEHCDEVLDDISLTSVLEQVDEVHTLTSLTGFEALLRGKSVTCYGQPFYAGWGLTADVYPTPRRSRRLALDELVAAALILYPTYISSRTRRFTTPERTIEEIVAQSHEQSRVRLRHLLRPLLRLQLHRRLRRSHLQLAQATS